MAQTLFYFSTKFSYCGKNGQKGGKKDISYKKIFISLQQKTYK